MQSSRERVLRAIEMRDPDRIPMWLTFNRDANNAPISEKVREKYESDVILARCGDPNFVPVGEGYHWLGYKYESFGAAMGEVQRPPLEDWGDFDEWKSKLPDFTKEICYEKIKRIRRENPDKFMVGGLFLLMEELINLRGYENYMTDFYDEEDNLNALIDVLYDIATKMVDGYAEAGFDAVMAWEDWGLQDSPMMSYAMWDKFFHAKMKAFVDHIHEKGMKYILHSCGHITYLLDTFEEMGIDALQLDQQKNMGLDVLKKWKGKFCFCCPVDIQHSLGMARDEMQAYIKEMNESLGGARGGFIYKPYEQPAAINMTPSQLEMEVELVSLS